MIVFSRFVFPDNLSLPQKVAFYQKTIEKLRKEAKLLRKDTAQAKSAQTRLEKQLQIWKEKYQKIKKERDQFKKENGKLKQEIEKLTKTNSRYRVSLFDSGNFKSPNTDEKKSKGGQLNHPDTNREGQANFPSYGSFSRKRIYSKNCGRCGNSLERVNATKEKVLLDIVIKPEIIQMILESERQWCGQCSKEINAKDPLSLPFTEYGLNTFMMVLVLRFKSHCSFASISKVIEISFGLKVSKSDISNMLKAASCYLKAKYEELKQAVRVGEVMYVDETGWLVKGSRAWMWIMASEDTTVYVAAESRGKGIAEEIYGSSCSLCMTDGLGSYTNSIPKDKHLLCWAHHLRFAFEETLHSKKSSMAVFLRDELVRIYHIKQNHPEYSKQKLEEVLTLELDQLLILASDEDSFKNIQNRLSEQKEGLVKALIETESGTNNLAERELRPIVLGRKVSFGSDSYTGMETTAILSSVIQTIERNKQQDMLTELTLGLQIGIHEKYPQYIHIPYFDTS